MSSTQSQTPQQLIRQGEANILKKLTNWLNDPDHRDDDVMDFILDDLGVKIYTEEDWLELQEEEEEEVNCYCDKCHSEGTTVVGGSRANELREKEIVEDACPYGDRCAAEE